MDDSWAKTRWGRKVVMDVLNYDKEGMFLKCFFFFRKRWSRFWKEMKMCSSQNSLWTKIVRYSLTYKITFPIKLPILEKKTTITTESNYIQGDEEWEECTYINFNQPNSIILRHSHYHSTLWPLTFSSWPQRPPYEICKGAPRRNADRGSGALVLCGKPNQHGHRARRPPGSRKVEAGMCLGRHCTIPLSRW